MNKDNQFINPTVGKEKLSVEDRSGKTADINGSQAKVFDRLKLIGHDFKTPLIKIIGMSQIIEDDKTSLSYDQKMALRSIKKSSQELLDRLHDFLKKELTQTSRTDLELQLKSVDINLCLSLILKKFETQIRDKKLKILSDFEPLFSVKLDCQKIQKVFSNLIENAIKYSKANTRVLISTEDLNNEIVIQISDEGPGIPIDEKDLVFEKFYRGSVSESGSGLGLFMVKRYVELHKGRVEVGSSHLGGTMVTVFLPKNVEAR